jgi:DNA-binding NtrC family response regulator
MSPAGTGVKSKERTRILVVDDEEIVRESLSAWLQADGYTLEVAQDGPTALELVKAQPYAIMLVDLKMPGMDGLTVLDNVRKLRPEIALVIMTAYATVDTAVQAIKNGAYDYLVKPFDPEELSLMIEKIAAQQELARENALLRKELKREFRFQDLVSKSPAMQAIFDLVRAAAKSNATILVLGESGTGKEVLARAIHAESPRSEGPFVAVSCAALTETLLESELFGHEKGAFTGALARRKGRFEQAQGGTLFLDEIGDISPKLQLDLLRVLEDRRLSRIGGNEVTQVDVRVVAATNRDLKKAVAQGKFREDLFYRLNVIPITLPPLRERREDVPLLVDHFLEQMNATSQKKIDGVSAEAMGLLMAHQWPGNIRELRNVLERGAVVSTSNVIQPENLGLSEPVRAPPPSEGPSALATLEEVEKRHIAFVLGEVHGNVTQAARTLGIDRATLYNKIKKYGLRKSEGEEEPQA